MLGEEAHLVSAGIGVHHFAGLFFFLFFVEKIQNCKNWNFLSFEIQIVIFLRVKFCKDENFRTFEKHGFQIFGLVENLEKFKISKNAFFKKCQNLHFFSFEKSKTSKFVGFFEY